MEEGNEHMPPGLFMQRLGSMPTLIPHFSLDQADVALLCMSK